MSATQPTTTTRISPHRWFSLARFFTQRETQRISFVEPLRRWCALLVSPRRAKSEYCIRGALMDFPLSPPAHLCTLRLLFLSSFDTRLCSVEGEEGKAAERLCVLFFHPLALCANTRTAAYRDENSRCDSFRRIRGTERDSREWRLLSEWWRKGKGFTAFIADVIFLFVIYLRWGLA